MKHLSIEEILNYINANSTDPETLAFIARVNEHVLSCGSCREKLEAYETIDSEMCELAFEKHLEIAKQGGQEAELVL